MLFLHPHILTLVLFILILITMAFFYYHPFSKKKLILKGRLKLNTFLQTFIFSIVLILIYSLIIGDIIARPRVARIPIPDFVFLIMNNLLIGIAFLGLGIHTVAKSLNYYLKRDKISNKEAYAITKFFLGDVSHFLAYTAIISIFFLVCLIEINHPSEPQDLFSIFLYLVGSLIFLFFGSVAWIDSEQFYSRKVNKILLFLLLLSSIILLIIIFIVDFDFHTQPFFVSGTFLIFLSTFLFLFRVIFKRKLY